MHSTACQAAGAEGNPGQLVSMALWLSGQLQLVEGRRVGGLVVLVFQFGS